MIGVRHASSQPRNFARKMVARLVKSQPGVARASGWKLWTQNLFGSSKPRLEELQNAIVQDLGLGDRAVNTMVKDEINQWHFHNPKARLKIPTLLVHGHAASAMAFHRNFAGLSDAIQDLYAIDLPANGLSKDIPLEIAIGRPLPLRLKFQNDTFKLPYTIEQLHHHALVQQFEDYYVDALEQWRRDNALGPINVVAHSFGGYLSFKYAVKYPQSVAKLCLVSPLGVERNAFAVNNQWSSNTTYHVDRNNPASKHYVPSRPAIPRFIFESQTGVLRALGPLGAKFCWNYICTVYQRVPSLHYKKYLFEMFFGKDGLSQTSKDVFLGLFTNRLLARDPLLESVKHLRAKELLLLYGDHDWMNRQAGQCLAQEAESRGIASEYNEVSSSGHNLFLDNPLEFDQRVIQFLER
ncbi:LAFA_0E05182g1_1 [Lachancea sp. 'fantastica']|nr:LAFA_0E05182g1_1 [Lachancea sp. 'fantastica']